MYAQELATHYREVRMRLWAAGRPEEFETDTDPEPSGDPQRREIFYLIDARTFYGAPAIREHHGIGANVIDVVCLLLGMTQHDLWAEHRWKNLVNARSMVWLIVRERTGLTLPSIGRIGYRDYDHTTVLHGITKMRRMIETDDTMRSLYGRAIDALDFHCCPTRIRFILDAEQ